MHIGLVSDYALCVPLSYYTPPLHNYSHHRHHHVKAPMYYYTYKQPPPHYHSHAGELSNDAF